MKNLIFFGAPGAGKGTQAKKLAQEFKLKHISTGDVLRAEVSNQTELGKKAKNFMDKGELVPDDIIISMVEKIISSILDSNGFILDGFPRTQEQAIALDKMLEKYNITISNAIFLDVPEEELIKRLEKRAELENRDDDKNENIIKNRIKIYKEKTEPVLNYYQKQGKLKKIQGLGDIDQIYKNIVQAIS
jgi:adenylate kinase